ncbi:hypothetical protein NDA12_005698 [Ustilago hordei]|nr:hypothetical protein NDA15_001720 [Ustilago hordei]KAJ1582923.1 hypothetical protein NDA12_005698 [Ustilago hordei]
MVAARRHFRFHQGARPWKLVAEGSNMGLDQAAIEVFENSRLTRSTRCWYAPGKAANLGGVAVSGLEMAQNSARLTWSQEQVEAKLNEIMKNA